MGVINNSNEDLLLEAEATNTKLDTLNTNGAKEAKQDTQITEAQSTNTKLDTLNANDFATEAKQDSQITEAQSTNTKLDTLNANDFATEAKQDDIITAIGSIGGGQGANATEDDAVSMSTTAATVIAANANRVQVIVRNTTNQRLYLKLGAGATTDSVIELKKGDIYFEDKYTGLISGILASGSGDITVSEVTP